MARTWSYEDGRPRRHKSHKGRTLASSHTWNWWSQVVFDGRYDLVPGFVRASASGYHFSRDHSYHLDEFEGLSVAHNFEVVRMITTSKDGFCDKSTLRFEQPSDWARCDVDFGEALKDWFCCFVGWPSPRAKVDLLDENGFFWKSDWPYYALGIQILKVRKHEFFNE